MRCVVCITKKEDRNEANSGVRNIECIGESETTERGLENYSTHADCMNAKASEAFDGMWSDGMERLEI